MGAVEVVGRTSSLPGLEGDVITKDNSPAREGRKEPAPTEETKAGRKEVHEAVKKVNHTMEIYRTELRFILDEESDEFMVRVINAETGEVIREIPPEWVLKIVADVKRMLGLILDKFI
ncbi:MAG: flagellar protein FlaG [Moorella humiferrea]|nr:flagellar protein FlaG [Moorella humiferrea]